MKHGFMPYFMLLDVLSKSTLSFLFEISLTSPFREAVHIVRHVRNNVCGHDTLLHRDKEWETSVQKHLFYIIDYGSNCISAAFPTEIPNISLSGINFFLLMWLFWPFLTASLSQCSLSPVIFFLWNVSVTSPSFRQWILFGSSGAFLEKLVGSKHTALSEQYTLASKLLL